MKWSQYSEAIFDRFGDGDNIIVQACPGAGKTTNIKHMWGLTEKSCVYLVFNKQNQLEAQEKLPNKAGSAVLTLNGLGHRALLQTYGQVVLDTKKVMNLIKQYVTPQLRRMTSNYQQVREMEWTLKTAVDHAKFLAMNDFMDDASYRAMLSTFDLEAYEGMQRHVSQVLAENDARVDVIDFNDQIRLPALHQCSLPQWEVVLGDEVQDWNPMQALLVGKLHAEQYVLVGDKRQSIYGWRGAMLDSMDVLKERFGCTELPLSITYRCARSIVREASAIWQDIEAWEESPDGTVRYDSADSQGIVQAMRQCTDPSYGIVLCRNNQPLISYAYELLAQGIACHVRGRDIGAGLIALVKKFPCHTVGELITAVSDYARVEIAKATAADDVHKAQRVQDKIGSLEVFMSTCTLTDPPDTVIQAIEAVFEQGKGVTLSTVHKAKGLEATSAYMLEHGIHDAFIGRSRHAWQAEQEKNVKYVAVTRGKTQLVYM